MAEIADKIKREEDLAKFCAAQAMEKLGGNVVNALKPFCWCIN